MTNCQISDLCTEGITCHDIAYRSDINKKPVKPTTVILLQQVKGEVVSCELTLTTRPLLTAKSSNTCQRETNLLL